MDAANCKGAPAATVAPVRTLTVTPALSYATPPGPIASTCCRLRQDGSDQTLTTGCTASEQMASEALGGREC
eukprot:scaffold8141_cov430-Prasinococcus_capsulatus_cf.AAC.5